MLFSTIIITMTTKSLILGQGMSLRSSRRLPALPPVVSVCAPLACSSAQSQPSDNNPPAMEHEELMPKMEKESTSPQRRKISPACERSRPITRSHASLISKPHTAIAISEPTLTQEGSSHKDQQIANPKKEKEVPLSNNPAPSEPAPSDMPYIPPPLIKKPISKPATLDTLHCFSPYSQIRKSYRKISKGQVVSFPYRKCHDPLQGRIVAILNKLAAEKDCRKEIEGLAERMARASSRQIRNRFVVAGIRMVLRMAKEREKGSGNSEGRLLARLQTEEKAFHGKILEELTDFSQFEECPVPSSPCPDPNANSYCALVMKKLYSALKRTHPQRSKGQIRKRVISQCQGFFSGEVSMDEMVRFVRKRLEG